MPKCFFLNKNVVIQYENQQDIIEEQDSLKMEKTYGKLILLQKILLIISQKFTWNLPNKLPDYLTVILYYIGNSLYNSEVVATRF